MADMADIDAQAPGKLYIAGEYAVTNTSSPAVLVAVDRFVHVHLHPHTSHTNVNVSTDAAADPAGHAPTYATISADRYPFSLSWRRDSRGDPPASCTRRQKRAPARRTQRMRRRDRHLLARDLLIQRRLVRGRRTGFAVFAHTGERDPRPVPGFACRRG